MALVLHPDTLVTGPDIGWLADLARAPWATRAAQFAVNTTWAVVNVLVVRPLASLYLHGPLMLGCWGGLDAGSICSHMSPHTTAGFWDRNEESMRECHHMIESHFFGWLVLARTICYFMLLGKIVLAVTRYVRDRLMPPAAPRGPVEVHVVPLKQ
jgi:hypothetical protein